MNERMKMICEKCNIEVKKFDGVHLTLQDGIIFLCSKCYNQRISEFMEFEFTHISFEPEVFRDVDGLNHTFNFTTHLTGGGVSIEANEEVDDEHNGYQFSIYGEPEEGVANLFNLFGQLTARIQKGLSKKHLEPAHNGKLHITDQNVVRGQITSDLKTASELPVLVIDGREVSWEELGEMVMIYEGFNFRLDIFDRSEER